MPPGWQEPLRWWILNHLSDRYLQPPNLAGGGCPAWYPGDESLVQVPWSLHVRWGGVGLHTPRAVGAAPTEEGDVPRPCGIRCPGKPKVEEPECALMFFTLGWYHGWDRLGPARVLHRFIKILPPPFAGGSPPHGYCGGCLRVPRDRPLPAPPARCPGTAAEVPCGGTAVPGAARARPRTRTRRGFSRAPSHTPAHAQLTPFCFVLHGQRACTRATARAQPTRP